MVEADQANLVAAIDAQSERAQVKPIKRRLDPGQDDMGLVF